MQANWVIVASTASACAWSSATAPPVLPAASPAPAPADASPAPSDDYDYSPYPDFSPSTIDNADATPSAASTYSPAYSGGYSPSPYTLPSYSSTGSAVCATCLMNNLLSAQDTTNMAIINNIDR